MCATKSSKSLKKQLSGGKLQSGKHQKHVEAEDSDEGELTVKTITEQHISKLNWEFLIDVEINGTVITMELDTAAETSVAPKTIWTLLGSPQLRPAPRLRAYGGANLHLLGQAEVDVKLRDREKRLSLLFLESDDVVPLFGQPWIKAFGAVSVHALTGTCGLNQLLEEFNDLFDTTQIGTVRGHKAHLYFKPDAQFRILKPRPLPLAI